MTEPELKKARNKNNINKKLQPEYTFHSEYAVKNEDGEEIGVDILILYYGEVWKPTLDRITSKIDGYLLSVTMNGYRFNVFRKLKSDEKRTYPPLRIVRN